MMIDDRPPNFRIRRLTFADLQAVLAIERDAYDYPWSEGVFRDCLRVGYRSFGAVAIGGHLMGYCFLSIAAGEAHVLNICVNPRNRRSNIAHSLLERMFNQALAEEVETLMLEVRCSNVGAITLYENMGFERVGMRKRYYPAHNGREDALLLSVSMFD